MASVVVNGDTSGAVTLSAPAVAGTVTVTLPATSGTMLTTASSTGVSGSAISSGTVAEAYGGTGTSTGYYGFKNRIINGAMVIDQRNAGASVTPAVPTYILDRWLANLVTASKFSVQQSTTAPAGFTNSALVTSTSAYTVVAGDYQTFQQRIEANNMIDAGWGTSSAQTFTLSFWVRSSLTGTFGGSLYFPATTVRTFPFTYVINSANTWEQKTITITGDTTSNTAPTGTNLYVIVQWSVGAGSTYTTSTTGWQNGNFASPTGCTNLIATNGANLYITGVQLEKGSTATSFDYRPYGTELQLCYRYFYKWLNDAGYTAYVTNLQPYNTSSVFGKILDFPVTMRATPACVTSGTFGASNSTGTTSIAFTTTVIDYPTKNSVATGGWTGSSGLVAGNASVISIANNAFIQASAEL